MSKKNNKNRKGRNGKKGFITSLKTVLVGITSASAMMFSNIGGLDTYVFKDKIVNEDIKVIITSKAHTHLNGKFKLTVSYDENAFKCYTNVNVTKKIYAISREIIKDSLSDNAVKFSNSDFRYFMNNKVKEAATVNLNKVVCDEKFIEVKHVFYEF